MAKKFIGSVDVWIDDDNSKPSSCIPKETEQTHPLFAYPNRFDITIRTERETSRGLNNLSDKEKLQTLLCHELGHFVGLITHDPKQHPVTMATEGKIPSELQAWELGSRIGYCDPTIRRRCLDSYYKGEKRDQRDPLLQELRQLAKDLELTQHPLLQFLHRGEAGPRELAGLAPGQEVDDDQNG